MSTIVIAWVDDSGRKQDGIEMRDGEWRPKIVACQAAKAVVWLNEGSKSDILKAKEYAEKNLSGAIVLTFPTTESNPLERAREAVMH